MSTGQPQTDDQPDDIAALVIGPYLLVHVLLLSYVLLFVWISDGWSTLSRFLPVLPDLSSTEAMRDRFALFQQLVLAACAAGLGGAVFMIREFYINYAYGSEDKQNRKRFLKRREIPRYVLLPISSVVMGPITVALLQIGAIAFVGVADKKDIPHFTIVAVGFILGFSYHDTLGGFRQLSKSIAFGRSQDKENSGQPKTTQRENQTPPAV
jgi:hypothetical protein